MKLAQEARPSPHLSRRWREPMVGCRARGDGAQMDRPPSCPRGEAARKLVVVGHGYDILVSCLLFCFVLFYFS